LPQPKYVKPYFVEWLNQHDDEMRSKRAEWMLWQSQLIDTEHYRGFGGGELAVNLFE